MPEKHEKRGHIGLCEWSENLERQKNAREIKKKKRFWFQEGDGGPSKKLGSAEGKRYRRSKTSKGKALKFCGLGETGDTWANGRSENQGEKKKSRP